MSDPRSKRCSLTQRAFIVEYYFCSNLYRTILQLYKKQFHDMLNIRTMKQTIEQLQTEYKARTKSSGSNVAVRER